MEEESGGSRGSDAVQTERLVDGGIFAEERLKIAVPAFRLDDPVCGGLRLGIAQAERESVFLRANGDLHYFDLAFVFVHGKLDFALIVDVGVDLVIEQAPDAFLGIIVVDRLFRMKLVDGIFLVRGALLGPDDLAVQIGDPAECIWSIPVCWTAVRTVVR